MTDDSAVSGYPVDVRWRSGLFWHHWHFTHEGIRKEFELSTWRLAKVPRDSRSPEARKRLRDAVGDVFLEWLLGAAREPVSINLRPHDKYWTIPWELIAGEVDAQRRRNVALVRRLVADVPVSPTRFDGPLRTLFLYGADTDPHDQASMTLDLEREATIMAQAWSEMDYGMRALTEEPRRLAARQQDLLDLTRTFRPHLVVFSGHGRPSTRRHEAGLLFADGTWVEAKEFRRLLTAPGWFPPFFAFWACDTAREHRPRPDRHAPRFAHELLAAGAVSMVAMQAPISDPAAIVLARRSFESMVSGLPIERAIATTRDELIAAPPEGAHHQDWAAPVVWASAATAPGIEWHTNEEALTQRQLVAWRVASASLGAAADPVLTTERARSVAVRWATRSTWVRGDLAADFADRTRWAETLRAVQITGPLAVLAVDLGEGNAAEAVAEWAERVYPTLLPGDLAHPLADLIRQLRRAPKRAWAHAAANPGLFLAVSLAGELTDDAWFWAPLGTSGGRPACAVMSAQPPALVSEGWEYEDIRAEPLDITLVTALLADSGRLVRVLAVLNFPLNTAWLELPEYGGASRLTELPGHEHLTIATSRGRVLRAEVRQHVMTAMGPEELVQAHVDAAALLSRGEIDLTLDVRRRRLGHLLGAGRFDDAVLEASDLLLALRSLDQPRTLLGVLRQLDASDTRLKLDLPPAGRLATAWAYLRLGEPQVARYWLDETSVEDPIVKAWKHALLAEIWKSVGEPGAKEHALAEVTEAVRICAAAIADGDRHPSLLAAHRAHRQDRARIQQYLFGRREEAAHTYRELLAEWQVEFGAAPDVAITKRNLAECIRTQSRGLAALEQAEALLSEAIDTLRSHAPSGALAELYYERAKTAALQDRIGQEQDDLGMAIRTAQNSGHDMIIALADNRRFWRFCPFDAAEWQTRARTLEEFPNHGWAVRALVGGRLRAARALAAAGRQTTARHEIELARAALEANPSFDQGKDRWRRAAVAAGLELVGTTGSWRQFRDSAPWVPAWLVEHGDPLPADVWSSWDQQGDS